MVWANFLLPVIVVVLVCLYFLPYRKLKGKIFKKLFKNPYGAERIRFCGKNFSVEFEKISDRWRMSEPDSWSADSVKVRRLLSCLDSLDVMGRLKADPSREEEYGIGKNGVLSICGPGFEIELSLGYRDKSDELIYVKKSGDRDVLLVSASLLLFPPKSVGDFKNMKIFDVIQSKVTAFEGAAEGAECVLTKTDNGWIRGGKNLFEEKAALSVSKASEIEATGFAPAGTRLGAKPAGFIALKIDKRVITRYLFADPEDETGYLVPVDGEILKVPKSNVLDALT